MWKCAGWSGPTLSAYARRHDLASHGAAQMLVCVHNVSSQNLYCVTHWYITMCHPLLTYQHAHTHSLISLYYPPENEALPGVLGNRGIRLFISGEQGNKSLKLKGTGEQRQFWGTGNIENQNFDFKEQGRMPIVFRGTREQETPPPGRASKMPWVLDYPTSDSRDSDQTALSRSLTWVFAARIWHKVHFLTLRLGCFILTVAVISTFTPLEVSPSFAIHMSSLPKKKCNVSFLPSERHLRFCLFVLRFNGAVNPWGHVPRGLFT